MRALPILVVLALAPGVPSSGAAAQQREAPLYDAKADARADLAAALARAKEENRRVLVVWGAEGNARCRELHELFTRDEDVREKLLYEYDVVRVDVGALERNLDLAATLGAYPRASGIPCLTVLGADGKPLANESLGEARFDSRRTLELLTKHQAPYLKADDLYRSALGQAAQAKKRVFLVFGAPW